MLFGSIFELYFSVDSFHVDNGLWNVGLNYCTYIFSILIVNVFQSLQSRNIFYQDAYCVYETHLEPYASNRLRAASNTGAPNNFLCDFQSITWMSAKKLSCCSHWSTRSHASLYANPLPPTHTPIYYTHLYTPTHTCIRTHRCVQYIMPNIVDFLNNNKHETRR